ncbi:Dyp-type peroxidase [Rhizobium sp. GN54]|uniref:Dyp-type peroxidase n=1 Tax=Rhizobium sp. GN54 TaxID=2898150 RepID=UPI001E63241A|nr:hypothetical protein [Rhizobium sp. GN54]MCD2185199.1 hypothetical protein [Rhizobium sp. GN54]
MFVDTGNVQRIVAKQYPWGCARHIFLHAPTSVAMRALLQEIVQYVCYGDIGPTQEWAINISFTYAGLAALISPAVLERFESAFIDGPQANQLGDAINSPSSPLNWWEKQFTSDQVHCIVHIHAANDVALLAGTAAVEAAISNTAIEELIPRSDGSRLDGRVFERSKLHFGYIDGLSKLEIGWDDGLRRADQVDFRSFVLGYHSDEIQSFPMNGDAADLVRDSSYMAFRWIYQDVASFEKYLAFYGPKMFPEFEHSHAIELLAAKMMGRWRDGTPLVLSPNSSQPALAGEDFTYAGDKMGFKCPLSAHIRVVNPRDQELMPHAKIQGVPRILRRGLPYGPPLASPVDDGVDRGVIGLFLCSNIRRQFITLMQWISRNDFSPDFDSHGAYQDPIMGNRQIPGCKPEFKIPNPQGDVTTPALPDFLRTKGTLYLMIPSRRTLQRLVDASDPLAH